MSHTQTPSSILHHPSSLKPTMAPVKSPVAHDSTFQPLNDSTLPKLESAMLKLPQVTCPVTNHFAPGIYWREITIPAGAIALGHKHKTEHLNVLLSGRVRVLCDGHVEELVAPQVFSSPPGTRKIVFALEPVRWANVHANPTNEHDMETLELIFVEKSAAFLAHQERFAPQPTACTAATIGNKERTAGLPTEALAKPGEGAGEQADQNLNERSE